MSKITEVQRQWFDRNGWPLDLNAVYAENEFKGDGIAEIQKKYMAHLDGGPGSGNWGHAGRPGIGRGGSAAGTGGKKNRLTMQSGGYTSLTGAYKENEEWNKSHSGNTPAPKPKKSSQEILREKLAAGEATREDFDNAEYGSMIALRAIGGYGKNINFMRINDDKWIDTKSGYIMTTEEVARSNIIGRVIPSERSDVPKEEIDKAQNDLNERLSRASDIDDVEDTLVTVDKYPNGITYTDKEGRTYVKIDDGEWIRQNEDGRSTYHANMLDASRAIGADYAEQHNMEPKSMVRRTLEDELVYENDVEKWDHKPSEMEIIETLSGADQTQGSCASLSLAYCANRAGEKVLDFRGGTSQSAIASYCTELKNNKALNPVIEVGKNDYAAVHKLQRKMEIGKEYILMTGSHAAIVRRTEKKAYEYLELQSGRRKNTWYPLNDEALDTRFTCQQKRRWKSSSVILDVEAVGKSKEIQKIMPYINTSSSEQLKGAGGGEK